MEIWSAFILGLVGSLHCIGMCAPIVAALPIDRRSTLSLVSGRLIYNFGRIASYMALGAVFGVIGKSIFLAGYQQVLSITLGVLILLSILLPARHAQVIIRALGFDKVFSLIRGLWSRLFRSASKPSLFSIGILNGVLPCGFVYVGVAGAVSTGGSLSGIAYMALFGLGTLPVMMTLSLAGNVIGNRVRYALSRFIPAMAAILAVLFILRGLSLGIPYISPQLPHDAAATVEDDCCRTHQEPN